MIDESVKKRLMFVKGEDFYFLTYNVLLILKLMNCTSENSRFRDYKKLSFLIDFISDNRLITLLKSNNQNYNPTDKELLNRAYANGIVRLNEVLKLLFALEKQGLVILFKETKSNHLDIYLNVEKVPTDFLDWDLFKIERQNVIALRSYVQRIQTLKLENLLDKLYYNYGIKQWEML